ncbi:hypothetical protein R1flu_017759 [Riccia fluitans]|uniref:Uncharacterized protein n=1 Tax=Riccia fluitans TaxID=41844 RepID=A0ABD1ZF78_9MARC
MVEPSRDYTIRVSKELMGVFRYVEKVKRARTRDLAETLRKVSQACFLLSCVRGVLAPLVRVYKTSPPNWKNLLYMIGTFDAFAVSYLAMRAAEPLYQLSALTTETDCDMIKSINKEEEHMLVLAIELVKLFRRMRNVALFIALTQLVQVIIQIQDPAFRLNIANILRSWFECPWGS